jgi:tRNA pseudouridine13 synthase
MKTLYCHALQSYLWNKIVSRRIREHGAEKLVLGDLVGVKPSSKK